MAQNKVHEELKRVAGLVEQAHYNERRIYGYRYDNNELDYCVYVPGEHIGLYFSEIANLNRLEGVALVTVGHPDSINYLD